jgi:acyl-CoA synthetase (AMP-forming)/AMP-acid ligase II
MTASTFFFLSLFDYEASVGLTGQWPATFNTGGATVPPSLIEDPDHRGRRGWRSYGSSEIPVVTSGDPDVPLVKRCRSDGRSALGSEIMIVDDDGAGVPMGETGEVLARGPQMFTGYGGDDAMSAQSIAPGGWFRTGDLGRLDYSGYLTIVGRMKDIVIRGGENISAKEVEDLLVMHPQVLEAACLPVPDPIYGERMCAVVRPRSTGGGITLDDVRQFFRERGVSVRKTPELVAVYAGDWPRTSYGKVLKPALLERLFEDGVLVHEDGAVRSGGTS